MQADPRICIVIPYFGKWPFWLPLFLESCRVNATVDWLIYTDCSTPSLCPPNVQVNSIDYSAYCSRVSSTLNIDFYPDNPYKLCDLKPALGLIHQDELALYDFWGFGDLDVVYGDLRRYFTAERLSRKDLFATHERRISGHLCLLRNTERMRTAFMHIPNWQTRLSDPTHHALDEGAFSRLFIRHKNFPKIIQKTLAQFNPWRRRSEFLEAYSTPGARVPWIGGGKEFPKRWYWRAGSLKNDLDGDREFPYFHFLIWKKHWRPDEGGNMDMEKLSLASRWNIDQSGFSEA